MMLISNLILPTSKKKKKKNPTLRFKLNAEMPFHSTRI